MTKQYVLSLDHAQVMEQAERDLPNLLARLWRLRRRQLEVDPEENADRYPWLALPGSNTAKIQVLANQVTILQVAMIDAEGTRGLQRYHELVESVARENADAREVFRILEQRNHSQPGDSGEPSMVAAEPDEASLT